LAQRIIVLNIQELIECAKNHIYTPSELAKLREKLIKQNEEWEMRQIQEGASRAEFLNKTYTI
jgi:hypothetical protein